jgi:hypothetical protein
MRWAPSWVLLLLLLLLRLLRLPLPAIDDGCGRPCGTRKSLNM